MLAVAFCMVQSLVIFLYLGVIDAFVWFGNLLQIEFIGCALCQFFFEIFIKIKYDVDKSTWLKKANP